MDILEAEELERVDPPDEQRTDARDEAADWIEDMWPATLSDIAEESGFSRQHIRNTLDTYFRPAGSSLQTMAAQPDTLEGLEDLPVPKHERDILRAVNLGYRLGYQDGREDAEK